MLKNILNLEGAQQLTTGEQKSIKGGLTKECGNAVADNGCYFVLGPQVCRSGNQSTQWEICSNKYVCC